ncbi:MAG: hypothetical protein M1832_004806 [Thelocarpon impressellum]|nr:MAG: hypothetical protein M1832_004806 [Thelocarpon impressellum]
MGDEPEQYHAKPLEEFQEVPENFIERVRALQEKPFDDPGLDEEKKIGSLETPDTQHFDPISELTHYRLVDEVWHFASVDWGSRYLCLGFNSLHGGSHSAFDDWSETDNPNVPKGKRLWSWLILCDDGTVLSIYEDPFPGLGEPSNKHLAILKVVRRNLVNVFRELSKSRVATSNRKAISILRIRGGLSSRTREGQELSGAAVDADAPSLLFYYLYDDWNSSYGLVARKEQQYGAELDRLRRRMLYRPLLKDIDRLHHIGRQLAVLKRIYQSYKLIIDRVLERQKPQGVSSRQRSHDTMDDTSDLADIRPDLGHSSSFPPHLKPTLSSTGIGHKSGDRLGVSLTPAAVVKLESLRDRISLYALSEIQECLDTKDALVLMAFNLIAMKESHAVERLTRITILLAKVTIMFLPVSLMTGYFSVQIDDIAHRYSITTYWAAFAVVMSTSILLLIMFGQASGTSEGKIVYQSLWEQFVGIVMVLLRGRKRKQ